MSKGHDTVRAVLYFVTHTPAGSLPKVTGKKSNRFHSLGRNHYDGKNRIERKNILKSMFYNNLSCYIIRSVTINRRQNRQPHDSSVYLSILLTQGVIYMLIGIRLGVNFQGPQDFG